MRATLPLLLAFSLVRGAFAADPPALGPLLKQRWDASQYHSTPQIDEINAKLTRANGEVRILSQPMPTDTNIDDLMQSFLYDSSGRLPQLRHELELSLMRDTDQRAALLKKAQADVKTLTPELARLRAPVDQQAQAARRAIASSNASYGQALTAFLRDSDNPKLTHDPFVATSSQALATFKDQDGKEALRVSISLNQNSALWYPLNRNKLDDKYVVGVYTNTNIAEEQASIKIGILCLNIFASQDQFKGDNTKLLNLLKTIVDLDALAAVKVD